MSSSKAPDIDVECVTTMRQPVDMSFPNPVFAVHLNGKAFPGFAKVNVDTRSLLHANRSEIS